MKFRFLFLSLAAGLALPLAGWTQAAGESAATPEPADVAESVDSGDPVLQRSALWQAVDAHHRHSDAQMAAQDRRLTPEQRVELREQLRQAWFGTDAQQATTASVANGVADQP